MFNNVSVLLHIVFAHIFSLQTSLQTKAMVKSYENLRSLTCSIIGLPLAQRSLRRLQETCSNNNSTINYYIVKTLLNHFMKDLHALGMSAGIEEQAFKNLFLIRLIFNDSRLSKIISFIKRPLLFFS